MGVFITPEASVQKLQVIDGDGAFNAEGLDRFVAEHSLAEVRTNYQVVAIMGPQSSGKSTLMNHLFGTAFVEMDAERGRQQTTKGVWLSKSPKLPDPTTLVLDLEGSDGRERGEDDTNFERQSALFALAVADVLLVNVWCHDIGREQGSGKPLMKTIFQVNLKLFAPEPGRHKTTLLFVIRDKSRTPLAKLTETLGSDVLRMWDSISKPPQYKDAALSDFFDVQYTALSHFEERHDDFVADVNLLRRRFGPDANDALCRPAAGRLPGDALPVSMRNIWEVIRSQKDLNLPAHKVMVANIRCAQIRDDALAAFAADAQWQKLAADAGAGLLPDFGPCAAALLQRCVAGYEGEAMYFDAGVRVEKQAELLAALHARVQPVFQQLLATLRAQAAASFATHLHQALAERPDAFAARAAECRAGAAADFDNLAAGLVVEGTGWTVDEARAQLLADLDSSIATQRASRLQDASKKECKALAAAIAGPATGLLETFPPGLWPRLHALARDATEQAESGLMAALKGYDLSEEESRSLSDQLSHHARKRLEGHVREAAATRLARMKDRFHDVFTLDANQTPRTWQPADDVAAAAAAGRRAAANVLAQLVYMRPAPTAGAPAGTAAGERADAEERDVVCRALAKLARADSGAGASASGAGGAEEESEADRFDLLSAVSWPGVVPESVLLAPHEVRTTWREFMATSSVAVQQALTTQQANRVAGSRAPPLWALLAIVFLGWNEFMSVLWNPVYLITVIAAVLFFKTLYSELDVDAEMARGALPGMIAIGTKLMPAVQRVTARTIEAVADLSNVASQRLQEQTQQAGVSVGAASSPAARAAAGGASRPSPVRRVKKDL